MEKIKKLVSKASSSSKMQSTALENYNIPIGPFKCSLVGSLRIDGLIKEEWIKELVKKVPIVIACQIGSQKPEWNLISPLLCAALREILKDNLIFNPTPNSLFIRRIHSIIDAKYISLLSYIPLTETPVLREISHRWEFESLLQGSIFMSYNITFGIEVYDYMLYDHYLIAGYHPIPDSYKFYSDVCNAVFLKIRERPLKPDDVFSVLAGESGRLKKLLKFKQHLQNRSICSGITSECSGTHEIEKSKSSIK